MSKQLFKRKPKAPPRQPEAAWTAAIKGDKGAWDPSSLGGSFERQTLNYVWIEFDNTLCYGDPESGCPGYFVFDSNKDLHDYIEKHGLNKNIAYYLQDYEHDCPENYMYADNSVNYKDEAAPEGAVFH